MGSWLDAGELEIIRTLWLVS